MSLSTCEKGETEERSEMGSDIDTIDRNMSASQASTAVKWSHVTFRLHFRDMGFA